MPQVSGFEVIAKAFASQGLTHSFGIVGVPITEIAQNLQKEGVKYYGFRNEQPCAYAAGIAGYLTKTPGLCLTVSGPGMTNAVSGMAEALINKRPMILLSGACDGSLAGRGAFQEIDQMHIAKTCCKWACRPVNVKQLPFVIEKAFRMATYGTPGPVYLDMPADVIFAKIDSSEIEYLPPIPILPEMILQPSQIAETLALLKSAKSPLVIVGKGVAYADAEKEFRDFAIKSNLPVLATPMGKGIIKDDHELAVNSARTQALLNADVIFLCGARLNWILHFGLPPRFKKDVKIIQLDNDPLEAHTNKRAEIALIGDAKVILG